jgi:(S)-mandelate dehydrogenase
MKRNTGQVILARSGPIEGFRVAAQRALPRMVFDYLDGGSGAESTLNENLAALQRIRLLPRAPVDVSARTTTTTVLGHTVTMPVVIGPTGGASVYWREGDVALATASAKCGIPFVMSIGATMTVEHLCERAGRPVWVQLYLMRNRSLFVRILERLEACGVEVLELTVDTAVPGVRYRDQRNSFTMPLKWSARTMASFASHPTWALMMLRSPPPVPSLVGDEFRKYGQLPTLDDVMRELINPAVSWDDLAWLRDRWKGKLIVKGLSSAQDAEMAVKLGMDGIVVSNHGGRQLDSAIATINVLPAVVAAVNGKLAVLVDGGFRSGTDVVKALALGASCVQLGRATLYALATGGAPAVDAALAAIHHEIDVALALLGVRSPAELNPSCLVSSGISSTTIQ